MPCKETPLDNVSLEMFYIILKTETFYKKTLRFATRVIATIKNDRYIRTINNF